MVRFVGCNGGWRSSPKALPSAAGPSTLSGSTVLAWIAWGNHGARRVGHLIASLGRAARASRLAGGWNTTSGGGPQAVRRTDAGTRPARYGRKLVRAAAAGYKGGAVD